MQANAVPDGIWSTATLRSSLVVTRSGTRNVRLRVRLVHNARLRIASGLLKSLLDNISRSFNTALKAAKLRDSARWHPGRGLLRCLSCALLSCALHDLVNRVNVEVKNRCDTLGDKIH